MHEKNKVFFPLAFDVRGWRFAPGRETSPSAYTIHILIKTRAYFRKCLECIFYILNFKCYFLDGSSYKLMLEQENGIGGHFLHIFFRSSVLQLLEEEKHMGVQ